VAAVDASHRAAARRWFPGALLGRPRDTDGILDFLGTDNPPYTAVHMTPFSRDRIILGTQHMQDNAFPRLFTSQQRARDFPSSLKDNLLRVAVSTYSSETGVSRFFRTSEQRQQRECDEHQRLGTFLALSN
jgi:hypothetical protein